VATIASERGRAVRLDFRDGRLRLSVTNPDSGSAEDEIDCAIEGPDLVAGFNARYLLDALGVLHGPRARFTLGDPGAPAILEDPSTDDAPTVVVMPMRV
jgi:DNA polymerase-3 subunit beta